VSSYSPLGGQRISKMNPVRQSDILEEIEKDRGKSGPLYFEKNVGVRILQHFSFVFGNYCQTMV
jgi:hypothetical protein